MTDPVFTAKITPSLSPAAQQLVYIYDQAPGSSGPFCNPAGLAAVLDYLANTEPTEPFRFPADYLRFRAAQLRGEGND
jgi:hypothetical protein